MTPTFIKTPYGVYDPTRRNGDFGINTFRYIIDTKDRSKWAYDAFIYCDIALCEGKRWPNKAFELGYVTDDRSQFSVTRDCYVYHACCVKHLGMGSLWLRLAKPPIRIYRPSVWSWRKYLITGEAKYKRRYEFWETISIKIGVHRENGKWKWGLPEFAIRMSRYMAEAANSQRITKLLNR